ncbi:hypothetical protein B0H17DRAFT_1338486 [Mycena rosella]|uniref:Uncharacterized protein n=1 Tax=Mycena rosella TaxID=1033263 RepID=A0AAD7G3M9_MYCRO|nr:hypothetical protein B0H17DRAFT_1338486 [Mycena rosella]
MGDLQVPSDIGHIAYRHRYVRQKSWMFGERETLGREALRKMPKYVALAEDDTDLVAFVAQVQAGNAKTRPVDLPPAPAFTRHHTIARIRLPYPPKPASEPTSISSAGGYGRTGGQDRQRQRKDVVVRTPIKREAVPAVRPGSGRGAASASTEVRVKKQRRRSSPNPHRPGAHLHRDVRSAGTEEDPHVGFECEQHVSESTPLERSRPALLHSPPSREPSILHSGAGLTPLTSVRGETDTRTRKGGAPSGAIALRGGLS